MDTPGQLVRNLYDSYQARNWTAAAELLHPKALLEMPATGERLSGRDAIMALQENYPEPWGDLTVLRVVSDDSVSTAAVEFEIEGPVDVFRCAAFWVADQGKLSSGVEYWVTVGGDEPPERPNAAPGHPGAAASG